MLQIKDISKEYRTGTLVQKALDHVSLNLRDNEFVAILGPSGSGKTTLLNIIGGLDRYDSGDLIINGISTKQYKDRDWDSYRNHTIGFVFQSYNLIPHQTVLSNVELALTISGISGNERRQKAISALEKVGLGDQIHKKPNQMSGGQMQRVAIARALVNDPDILLADEPTGALDSETSVQVMDLLKEVARDRLVVMVTHNPELAEQYATRIVKLKDGVIRSDTDPYEVEEEKAVHKNMGKSSMSLLTALSLSFNNLRTKFTRTILVAFAGSIGIIGIALIIALSNGVNQYIKDTEEETLLGYPVQITSTSFDLASMMAQAADADDEKKKSDVVTERPMINNMLGRTKANDLASLKKYMETESDIGNYVTAIEYTYSLTPHIYRLSEDDYRQVNPDSSLAPMGFGGTSTNSMLTMAMSTDMFYSLPQKDSLYKDKYDIVAGHWPQNNHELVLVLFSDGSISDFMLYTLGLRDSKELDDMIARFMNEENVTSDPVGRTYQYEDFLGIRFKLVNSADYYRYDSEYEVWVDKTEDHDYMMNLVRNGEDMEITGVAVRKPEVDVTMLTSGIYYPYDLKGDLSTIAYGKDITKEQMRNHSVNVFTGRDFSDTEQPDFGLESMFTVNTDILQNAFQFDSSALKFDENAFSDLSNMDFSDLMGGGTMEFDSSAMPSMDLMSMLSDLDINIDQQELLKLAVEVVQKYMDYASKDPSTDYSKLPQAFTKFLFEDSTGELLRKEIWTIINNSNITTITPEELTDAILHVTQIYEEWAEKYAEEHPEEPVPSLAEYLRMEEGHAAVEAEAAAIVAKHEIAIQDEDILHLVNALADAYEVYARETGSPDISKLPESFMKFVRSREGSQLIRDGISRVVDEQALEASVTKIIEENSTAFADAITEMITNLMTNMMTNLMNKITDSMTKSMSGMADQFANAISFDASAFSRAFSMTMDEEDLQELMMSMMNSAQYTYDGNLRKIGYTDMNKPSAISIYPRDFESKSKVIQILNEYNERMKKENEDKVITFTDVVGVLMSSVTRIVDMISYVLIAFVAISLVVSSIMIGVITYISVLERKKEIGILRAIGASKRNISEVFNAETFIIGLLAGLLGVGISRLLLLPGNYLIHVIADNQKITAYLPVTTGLALIALSVMLTLIGGIIPSRKAARQDPVTALRTE